MPQQEKRKRLAFHLEKRQVGVGVLSMLVIWMGALALSSRKSVSKRDLSGALAFALRRMQLVT